ncbi:glycosyltransferase family 1 protein [Candidatus Parcubacteria bacterium]|nr:MAG: glycosyltransferase family 1 protein [Candidatus Parcubacteria bacterium]
MKMIYLANARIPTEKAHGVQIMSMCDAFKAAGVDIELVVAKRKDNQLENTDPFLYYGINNRFLIHKLWLLDIVAWGRSFKGLSVLIQNTSFGISAMLYLLFKKADFIYSRDEFSLFLISLFKKNIVLELHTFPNSKLFLYKFLLKRTKKIITITELLKKLLVEKLNVDPAKIQVNPDGINLDQFDMALTRSECRRRLNLPQEKKIIIYCGHLFGWKGVYTLAESSKYLADDNLIVFVGGMEHDKNKLGCYIRDKNLKNVILLGHKPPTEIPFYLNAADAAVLPNSAQNDISKFYTSPMKLFEYMAAKIPIVASDLPSVREILNENNSLLVKPDNPMALAAGIRTVLNDELLAQRFSDAAYCQVKSYTWRKRVQSILSFITK